jgi:cytochrome c peroxidase
MRPILGWKLRVIMRSLVVSAAVLMPCAPPYAQPSEPIDPLPLEQNLDPAKVALGEKLFDDHRLSKGNENACSTCHAVDRDGGDGLAVSRGLGSMRDTVNTLTIFNSGFNFRQNWDGRNVTLEDQANAVIADPRVMGSSWPEVIDKLSRDESVVQAFRIYPDGLTATNIVNALVTYERSLITPNAPFDRYLRGDVAALTDDQIEGYRLFKTYGCVACHQGMQVGGNMFQVFGVFGSASDYFEQHGPVTDKDFGRYRITKDEDDRFVFRVPSLRNVAVTAPYFNDGSAATLPEAVRVMAQYQIGHPISAHDVELIVDFLDSLTGEYQGVSLADPSRRRAVDLGALPSEGQSR